MNRKTREFYITSEHEPDSFISEAFRAIRTSVHYASKETNRTCYLITSSLPGEGKTSIAANLAILSAREGKRTLLIDCDLRRPNIHFIMRRPNRMGVVSVLTGHNELNNAIVDTDIPNLSLLPAGPIHPSPAELLSTTKMSALISECKERYDLVYIDSTSLLPVSDASILTRIVDGIILVVRAMHVKKEQLQKANQILEPSKQKILGIILNDKKLDQYSIV